MSKYRFSANIDNSRIIQSNDRMTLLNRLENILTGFVTNIVITDNEMTKRTGINWTESFSFDGKLYPL